MKIGVIGAGAVGSACLLSLATQGVAREIVVMDRDRRRAQGVVADLGYGATLAAPVELVSGDYADLDGAGLVIITAGVNEKAGRALDRNDLAGRLRLLEANASIYRDVVPRAVAAAPNALLLVVSDPPDALAELSLGLAGHAPVLSTGTFLDSQRFRFHVAKRLGVHACGIEAQVLGEHGTSQVFVWSGVRVGGVPLCQAADLHGSAYKVFRHETERNVRYANIDIIEGTGASQLGIALVTARIAKAVLRDERVVLPIGSHQTRYATTLSLPTVVGRSGVVRVLRPALDGAEEEALELSAATISAALGQLANDEETAPKGVAQSPSAERFGKAP